MASKKYKMRCLTVKKTKLAEKDLIVTLVDDQGQQVRAVAKGARKPGSQLAARLEIANCVDVVCAEGRSLDIICEAHLSENSSLFTGDMHTALYVSPLLELLCTITQPDLPQARLFDICYAALEKIKASAKISEKGGDEGETSGASKGDNSKSDPQCDDAYLLALLSASLWKLLAQAGFKPSFKQCALCGSPINPSDHEELFISVEEGGVLCSNCQSQCQVQRITQATLLWCDALIHLRFDDLKQQCPDLHTTQESLSLLSQWARFHTGRDIKSLHYLLLSINTEA